MNVAKLARLDKACPIYGVTTTAEFSDVNAREFLEPLACFYPGFHSWLNFTFVRRLKDGTRKALIVKDKDEIQGIALLKITSDENKICTFFVAHPHRGKGVGKALMKHSLSHFNGQVSITVCDERREELSNFLESYEFKLQAAILGFYRKGHTEYFYTR